MNASYSSLVGAEKKDAILDAAVRLAAREGLRATSMRAIAREVGLTEAGLYRHFPSKSGLWVSACARIAQELASHRGRLSPEPAPFAVRIADWVRLTLGYYDANPAAFTFAFLAPNHDAQEMASLAGEAALCREILADAMQSGEIRTLPLELAHGFVTGLARSVPLRINAGVLAGPAASHADAVAAAIRRVFDPSR